MTAKKTILFSGMIAGDPHQGGATWAILQFLLGFRRLGHDVFFVEPIKSDAISPASESYFRSVMSKFGFNEHSALLREGTQQTVGLTYASLREIANRADAIFNVSGMLIDPAILSPIAKRVYLDLDPAFIQLWHATQGVDMRFDAHTDFVTIGQAIGEADCPVPTCGRRWITTLQPCVLEYWPVAETVERDALTTIGNWRGYGSIHHAGVHFGQKAHSIRELIQLPKRTDEKLIVAMAIHSDEQKDLIALRENAWHLEDPASVASTPADYARFIRGSKGEIGIAKSGYVNSRCGWFSDRSVCYLASGRPVIAQETGFSRYIPSGEGLIPFTTTDDAVTAIESLRRDPAAHARAARHIAETYFESDRVLSSLLEKVGVT